MVRVFSKCHISFLAFCTLVSKAPKEDKSELFSAFPKANYSTLVTFVWQNLEFRVTAQCVSRWKMSWEMHFFLRQNFVKVRKFLPKKLNDIEVRGNVCASLAVSTSKNSLNGQQKTDTLFHLGLWNVTKSTLRQLQHKNILVFNERFFIKAPVCESCKGDKCILQGQKAIKNGNKMHQRFMQKENKKRRWNHSASLKQDWNSLLAEKKSWFEQREIRLNVPYMTWIF